MVEVRLLRPDEAAVLDGDAAGVFDNAVDPAAARAFLADPEARLAVALHDGAVVGMASAHFHIHPDRAEPELWIDELGVAPPWQRRGIGTRLMHCLFAAARDRGAREVWVLSDPDDPVTERFYPRAGSSLRRSTVVMWSYDVGRDPE